MPRPKLLPGLRVAVLVSVVLHVACGQSTAAPAPQPAVQPPDPTIPTTPTTPTAAPAVCTTGDTRCSGTTLQTCAGSTWNAGDPCSTTCATDGPTSAHCATVDAGMDAQAPYLAVFSAFPAETAPLLAQMTVSSTTVINGHTFRIGTLKGARVAVGLTGVGLPNATATAHALLQQLPVTGVVFSGVAGSTLRIGDVVVPTGWQLKTGTTYATDPAWLALASGIVKAGTLCLDKCTVVPATGAPVCLDHVPAPAVGGAGQSTDASATLPCQAGGDDVFGCDVGAPVATTTTCQPMGPAAPAAGTAPVATDNETAAVAAEAAARGLPFIAFRGVSDGAGDPLGLPGFPTQFFAYYRLAARNAAAMTIAFVEQVK
jgi:nucleoside phosphorylase